MNREDSRLPSQTPPNSPNLSVRKLVWEHLAVDVNLIGGANKAEVLRLAAAVVLLMQHHCNETVTLRIRRCCENW